MIAHCERELAGGPKAPLTSELGCAWLMDGARQMRKRVHLITRGYRGEGPMTSYSIYCHTLALDIDEVMVLKEALEVMREHCRRELGGGPQAPYSAWLDCASQVEDRLFQNYEMTSCTIFGNNT